MLELAVVGASGRLGKRILACMDRRHTVLVGAYTHADHAELGLDAGVLCGESAWGVSLAALPSVLQAQVVVDVSTPEGVQQTLEALAPGVALVVGVTGLPPSTRKALEQASCERAVLVAANFSAGVQLLAHLVALAAQALPEADIEIIEAHHSAKVDAPSGTAWLLARAAAGARGLEAEQVVCHGRQGRTGPRERAQIGIHALRMGDVVGEHHVYLASQGERVLLGHTASSRDAFARGALRAAGWLATQPAGSYTMHDVLGMRHDAPARPAVTE